MLETIQAAPPDAILGLSEAFKSDPNPNKINLGVGVYKDATGKTPILPSVKTAEERILKSETSKSYLPIDGSPDFAAATQALLFGSDGEIVTSQRAVTAQTPGRHGRTARGGRLRCCHVARQARLAQRPNLAQPSSDLCRRRRRDVCLPLLRQRKQWRGL